MKKILVIGGSGYIGKYLGVTIPDSFFLKTCYKQKNSSDVFFDLSSSKLDEIVTDFNDFSHVIIMAGVVRFNEIRNNPDEARIVNVEHTKRLVDAIIRAKLIPVFISSESVFDGITGSYTENDDPNPVFSYGRHKYDVEKYIREVSEKYLIIRLSKVFDSNMDGSSLISDWLNKINGNLDIYCANDHIFTPIHIEDTVIYIEKLIAMDLSGIYHISSLVPYRRDQMLEMVINSYSKFKNYSGKVVKQSLHSFQGAEDIPLNTSMDPSKIIDKTGVYPRSVSWWIDKLTVKFINSIIVSK